MVIAVKQIIEDFDNEQQFKQEVEDLFEGVLISSKRKMKGVLRMIKQTPALKYMPSTPMTQQQMRRQSKAVSQAVSGDPGEEDERFALEDHYKKMRSQKFMEIDDLANQVRLMIQSIKVMAEVAETKIEIIEYKVGELESEIASNRQQ